MRLVNQSRYPDELLEAILLHTAEKIGASPDIVIKVTQGRVQGSRGIVYSCTENRIFLSRGHITRSHGKYKWVPSDDPAVYRESRYIRNEEVPTNSAYMHLTLNNPVWISRDPIALSTAEWLLFLVAHEWSHVRDFQEGRKYEKSDYVSRNTGEHISRRVKHDLRDCEIEADRRAKEFMEASDAKRDDLILELAEWFTKRGTR